ncbi:Sodium-dependent phosphate transport protein 1 [Armadillidium vulgare]|nr:Sodium-dependent phosphate transport protein 1 [Armadillidium vulgare]
MKNKGYMIYFICIYEMEVIFRATVGGTLGVFLSGWLSEALGWPSLFYIGGKSAPWLKITTSPYVLICIYGTFARSWLDQILNNEGPSFFGYKIGLDVDTSSYIVGVSSISSVVFMLVCGKSSDYITNKKILSRLNTRKLFHIIGSGIPVIILLGLTWTGCNSTAAIIWFVALAGTTVATISSFTLSVIDIAPNHTGTVNALFGGWKSGICHRPIYNCCIDNGWNKSFYLCAGINAISLIIYVLFMTDKPQPWNFDKERKGSAAGSINQEPKGSPAGTRNKEPKDSPTGSTNRRRKNSPSGSLNKETKDSPTGRNEEPKDSTTGSLNKEPKDNPIGSINREPKDSPTGTISKEPKTSPASTIKLEPKISPVDKTKL